VDLLVRVLIAGLAFAVTGFLVTRWPRLLLARGPIPVAVLTVAAAAGAVAAGGAPTPLRAVNVVLRAALAAAVTAASARARRQAWLYASTATVIAGAGAAYDWLAFVATGVTLAMVVLGRRSWMIGALIGACLSQVLLRLDLGGTTGTSATVAAAVAALLIASGLRRCRRSTRRRTWIATGVLAGVAVVLSGAAALAAVRANGDVHAGIDAGKAGLDAARSGDVGPATEQFDRATDAFARAGVGLGRWWTRPALAVPVVGHQLQAARRLSSAGRDLATAASSAASELDLKGLRLQHGAIDMAALGRADAALGSARQALDRAAAAAESVTSPWLLPPLQTAIDDFDSRMAEARRDVGTAAVPREGIAALDPRNGLPLDWNPGRDRGEGAWALVTTPTGLWVGSDTNTIGGETHDKLAEFPLAGGTPDPAAAVSTSLPGDLYTVAADGTVSRRYYDGSVVGAATIVVPAGNADWSSVRGAFAVGNQLYTGRDDGRLQVRTINPDGSFGPPSDVDLYGTPDTQFPVTRLTGMFYADGFLYHTVSGDGRLFSRAFSPDSNVVGWDVTVAGGNGDGLSFNGAQGLTLSSGHLTYSRNGALRTVDFANGAPVPGTDRVIANATGDWSSLGMFVLPGHSAPPAPGQLETAGTTVPPGYWMAGSDGAVYAFGSAAPLGSLANTRLNRPIVTMAATPSGAGYWLVATDGGIFAFGDAGFYGSTGGIPLNKPIVGMAATPSGKGYWLVASDGGIFAFGDAAFYGSTGAVHLNRPIVGMAATPSGKGYWLVASDGGIFAFGDAAFYGSTGAVHLNRPIVGMAATPSGAGYWLTASDGGVFAFGDAGFFGSTGAVHLNQPIVGMAPTSDGRGYWFTASDGGIFAFGDADFLGSAGGQALKAPVVSFLARH